MALASQTVSYTTIATLALDKLSDKIADAISTSCAAFFMYKKKGNWEGTKSGGRQLRKPVMYQLQTIRPLGSFGSVNVNPIDSHTSVYYDWVQAAVPVSFSDMEEFQTGGEESIETIVKAKYQQEPSQFGAAAFDAFNILMAAIQKVGTEPAKLCAAIEETKSHTGVYGVFNYSATDHSGLGKESLVMYRVTNGAWKLIK